MKNMTFFQMIILAIFGLAATAGIIYLASYSPAPDKEVIQVGAISIWGTYDERVMKNFIEEMARSDDSYRGISYREFSQNDFNQELLEALAEDRSPDLLLLSNREIYENRNRIISLGADTLSRKTYRDTYLEVGESYFWDDAILGLPFLLDPMITFWNRSLFSNEGLVRPPTYWGELFSLSERLTEKDQNLNISRATVAMGEVRNVTNAKEVLATLAVQSGNPFTANSEDSLFSTLKGGENYPSLYQSLLFFTEFSNPSRETYSWNRSLPESEIYFLGGNLALHFGFASDILPIQLKNPNLNFDISHMLQVEGNQQKAVYADLYGFFIPRGATDPNRSYLAMNILTNPRAAQVITDITKLTSPRRDFSPNELDEFTDIFRDEAIYSRTFIDPNNAMTEAVIQGMVENITSGRRSIDQSIDLANEELNVLINER